MHEIEAKIRLTPKEFKDLKKSLSQEKKMNYRGQFNKKDVYYQNPIPHLTLRIRTINQKSQFQVKYRSMQKGVEINKEWEWPLKRVSLFKGLLKKAGLRPYATKTKRTDLFVEEGSQIELNFLKGLGYFLEVEILLKKESGIEKAKKNLEFLFKRLGFEKERFEKKPYLELLKSSV